MSPYITRHNYLVYVINNIDTRKIVMSHYTISYHDAEQHHLEICEYADDAYQAIQNSQEDVPILKGHPHFIDKCIKEEE